MPQDSSIASIKETFEDWSMYEAVIAHDYMAHRELADGLKTIAAEAAEPLRIVDLGCGDAWLPMHAFRGLPVESYSGVDLSESAVDRARRNTVIWESRAKLSAGNLAEFVANLPDAGANFILASNSLHHFDSDGKAAIVQHCCRALASQGVFCWIDPVRNEDESRDQYLGRLTTIMQNDWVKLTLDQRRGGIKHVLDSDYPETWSWMRQITGNAGFEFDRRFLETDLFGGWKFIKR